MVFGWVKRLFQKSDSLTHPTHSPELTHSPDSLTQETHSLTQFPGDKNINLQKDALELGLAAGYAGRSLKSIETSLERLESLIITKDWASQELLPLIKSIDQNEQKRFETIVSILNSIDKVAQKSPINIKHDLMEIGSQLESHGNLTNRMIRLINAIKEAKEIDYTTLAEKLNLSEDGLRSLVSVVCRKTNEIQKFRKGEEIWLKYVSQGELTHSLTKENEI